ncbi:hypothetical protein BD410DRAFT_839228 [Rickenella mellea]|uniref:Protein kinase domain-containing protein n=1 Tax=Rickenella mellea TaxID=50990 RepID=A0A4Y7Q6E4_9AGAM|nr:hypothetical protein BD410DRAFT_839228 [Rickenella mellea]
MSELTISVLVKGDTPVIASIFPIQVLPCTLIDDLRFRLVRDENIESLEDQNPRTIDLWELHVPVRCDESEERFETILSDLPTFANVMPPSFSVGAVLKNRSSECLHVVVAKPDITSRLARSWAATITVPTTIEGLCSYMEKPLDDHEKIPASEAYLDLLVKTGSGSTACSREDLEILFRLSDKEITSNIYINASNAIINEAPLASDTGASFINFWDNNIRQLFVMIGSAGTFVRDNNSNTSTRLTQPDLGYVVGGVCTFRGEEKQSAYSTTHPKLELVQKLTWTYDPAPYVLAYYAIAATVTFVAITPQKEVVHLVEVNLAIAAERVRNVMRMIRLYTLAVSLQRLIGNRASELIPMEMQSGNVIVIGTSNIKKTYGRSDRINRLRYTRNIYNRLEDKDVPNVDHLIASYEDSMDHGGSVLYLEPKGIASSPASHEQVLEATICILEALVVLHEPPSIFHRDIRWPNIVRRADDSTKWFLIDFEDAAMSPTSPLPDFKKQLHHPNIFKANHGAEVDIWAIGKLIVDANDFVRGLSTELLDVGTRLLIDSSSTASQLLTTEQWSDGGGLRATRAFARFSPRHATLNVKLFMLQLSLALLALLARNFLSIARTYLPAPTVCFAQRFSVLLAPLDNSILLATLRAQREEYSPSRTFKHSTKHNGALYLRCVSNFFRVKYLQVEVQDAHHEVR